MSSIFRDPNSPQAGVATVESVTQATVTSSVTEVLAANAARRAGFLTNKSPGRVYYGFFSTMSASPDDPQTAGYLEEGETLALHDGLLCRTGAVWLVGASTNYVYIEEFK